MILVVGGTGDLGARVVRQLLNQDHPVRCLVRTGSDAAVLRSLGVEIAQGDLTDAASLAAACAGVDVVVLTATAIGRRLSGERVSIRDVDELGGCSLVEAAEHAGVQRFVYVSFPGAHAAMGTPLERAKVAVEQRLQSSAMRSVILRSDAFQEIQLAPVGRFDLAHAKVAIIGRGDCKRRWIATQDVAALTAALALEPDPPDVLEVGGPEAISKNELLKVAERVTGRRVKRQRMPRSVARLAVRVLSKRNDALASAFGAGLHQDLVEAWWDDTPLRERGIVATSASDFVTAAANAVASQH
jgi:uncharacterized protein YbjT (DUF2867 family)